MTDHFRPLARDPVDSILYMAAAGMALFVMLLRAVIFAVGLMLATGDTSTQ